MANESFAEFAATLQKEIEDETGVKFGMLNLSLFSGMVYEETRQEKRTVTVEQAAPITTQALTGTAYTATVIEEKTVTYDDAKELMEHFQKKD